VASPRCETKPIPPGGTGTVPPRLSPLRPFPRVIAPNKPNLEGGRMDTKVWPEQELRKSRRMTPRRKTKPIWRGVSSLKSQVLNRRSQGPGLRTSQGTESMNKQTQLGSMADRAEQSQFRRACQPEPGSHSYKQSQLAAWSIVRNEANFRAWFKKRPSRVTRMGGSGKRSLRSLPMVLPLGHRQGLRKACGLAAATRRGLGGRVVPNKANRPPGSRRARYPSIPLFHHSRIPSPYPPPDPGWYATNFRGDAGWQPQGR
jgi:hypothetical protein